MPLVLVGLVYGFLYEIMCLFAQWTLSTYLPTHVSRLSGCLSFASWVCVCMYLYMRIHYSKQV
ncbi:hypothetical protein B0T10DRAFT_479003 [Thelonectria olida]|uniref:Uncharacterized protein n=1 Tax=Thelonectria olida TaxID=1576542 RepID=A0A9P9AU27_9HYPO|nr:hypothetical protein B0T10DRAFT_479003 [Thelonectria olida]